VRAHSNDLCFKYNHPSSYGLSIAAVGILRQAMQPSSPPNDILYANQDLAITQTDQWAAVRVRFVTFVMPYADVCRDGNSSQRGMSPRR